MTFNNMLNRASLNNLKEFLFNGGESAEPESEKTYAERLKEADKKITAFFESRFTDIDEIDEVAGYYYKQAEVYRDVYFEMGLITGAKIAFELAKRIEELL